MKVGVGSSVRLKGKGGKPEEGQIQAIEGSVWVVYLPGRGREVRIMADSPIVLEVGIGTREVW